MVVISGGQTSPSFIHIQLMKNLRILVMYLRQRGLSVCERRKRDDDACPGKIEDHYEVERKIAWAHWAKELNYLIFSHVTLP